MKNTLKYCILCLTLNVQQSFSCQTIDYVFKDKSLALDTFMLKELIIQSNLSHNFLDISKEDILEKYEKECDKAKSQIMHNSFYSKGDLKYGELYLSFFKDIKHLKTCFDDILSLHPYKRYEESSAFFGFISYFFNRRIEIWVDDKSNNIEKIRAYNTKASGTPIKILFMRDSVFTLHYKVTE